MKFAKMFIPTTKEVPSDAQLASHIFLARGGFVSQVASGLYSYMPLAKKVIKKIPEIGQIERLKEELIKKNKEIKKIKETAKEEIENKYKKQIWDLTKALNSDLSMELKQELDKKIEDIEKLQSIIKTKNNELNYKNKQLQEQQKKIRELTPKNKYKNKDFKGIGF